MYSLVLFTALTPGFHGKAAPAPVVIGCTGCTGYSYSCSGYSCSGYSTGCYGSCYGSRHHCFFGSHAGLFGHRHSCSGCTGYSCSGWSCFGSCTGYSCGGCTGMSWGGPVYTNPNAVYGNVTNPNPPAAIPPAVVPPEEKKDGKMGANIKFQLPADAKLYVDGRLTSLTGTERAFVTPALGAGKFFYEVKAEMMVDGQMVIEQKRVIVEAGSSLVEAFPKLIAAAGAKGDPVAGK